MITFKNEIKTRNVVQLRELNDGVFFEYQNKIFLRLAWDDDNQQVNCLDLSTMTYVGFEYDNIVRPVDVEITVTGYTKSNKE